MPRIELKCVAQGNPLPSISWYKNGLLIVQQKRSKNGDSATTHVGESMEARWSVQRRHYKVSSILKLGPSGTGAYWCDVRNTGRSGGMQSSETVIVR